MKTMKRVFAVMLGLCLMFTAFCFTKVEARAAESVTYTLRVVNNEWRCMAGYPWNDSGIHLGMVFMEQYLNDGDKIVVDDDSMELHLTVEKRLESITFAKSKLSVIYAPGIDNVYVLDNSVAAINCDVKNGYVYQNATANFNNNLDYLEVYNKTSPLQASVYVGGTVGHVKAYDAEKTHFEFYDFTRGTLHIDKGSLKTNATLYSNVPVATPAPTAAPVTKPSASAADELDDVPKTGDMPTYYWMFGLAAACLVMGMGLKFASGKEER